MRLTEASLAVPKRLRALNVIPGIAVGGAAVNPRNACLFVLSHCHARSPLTSNDEVKKVISPATPPATGAPSTPPWVWLLREKSGGSVVVPRALTAATFGGATVG